MYNLRVDGCMNNLYEENLKLFKNRIPMLYETVMKEKSIFEIDLETINETFNYKVIKDDKKCFIHSIFDINNEMDQMFKNVDRTAKTLVVFWDRMGACT